MFSYEQHMLVDLKRKQIEKAANEAWKFASITKENMFVKVVKNLKVSREASVLSQPPSCSEC
ncbi:hypothetical protein CVD25_13390 [Bacillus canaveralius]|uniref:Uncharacterized protein n=1 Tax=Bacillus canaveralius TaxID=1403243 RepID=A0A2N5GGK9_9BACI|nr:hypothetical protein [Bacillus canaveralius]PLR79871.1 hypothetical protein CU635_20550 [Bacillus canaveralius]PLR96040.1 hypothetical protein CVD25_13390 [Bacillus canaveralius]RSK51595.1 hypothetical protein EJA13_13840 [Bacillus canaveralius]